MGAPTSSVICVKSCHPLFHDSRPDDVGEDISTEAGDRTRGFVNLPFPYEMIRIIQLMSYFNSTLHCSPEEPIYGSEPSMQGPTASYERRLVGSSRRTMSATNSTISKINRLTVGKAFCEPVVVLGHPCRLRREHVTLRHKPRALLDDLLA